MVTDLVIEPKTGQFDTKEIINFLDSFPHTFRDPNRPEVFLLCGTAEYEKLVQEKLLSDQKNDYPLACIIRIHPSRIDVKQECTEERLEQARKFVTWLLKRYQCTLKDMDGNDWTEKIQDSIDILYSD